MRKNYVLDTNVLLQDPRSFHKFEDNNTIIPIFVLEEIDKFKNEQSERGRNAREVSRLLEGIRYQGNLREGIEMPDGGRLSIYVPDTRGKLNLALVPNSMDSEILNCALEIKDKNKDNQTILVTRDVNLRIRSDILGIVAETYEHQSVKAEDLDTGMIEIEVTSEDIDYFYKNGYIDVDKNIIPNTFITMVAEGNAKKSALGRYKSDKKIYALNVPKEGILGIKPRSREQQFALDMLLDDNIKLVNLQGLAGTGKSLLALCAGLYKTCISGSYTKMLVARPIVSLGKDLGALPGTLEEKLNPWMQPIYDNLDFLMMNKEMRNVISRDNSKNGKNVPNMNQLFDDGIIAVEPLTYIRGRSIPHQFMIIDESQNLNLHEVKTILSRAGEGTKIVLTSDPAQIDNPYLDALSCGPTIVSNKLKGENLFGHITLQNCERSALAELVATKL